MSEGRLTVVTPSYNQARFIRRTIESVLSQDVTGLEYLVFDGGSTDGTVDILSEYAGKLTAVIGPDAGQSDAVNKGFARAAGNIIGWLNSDDVYYAGAVRRALEIFEAHPQVDVLYGEADHIDEADQIIEPYPTEPFDYERLKKVCFLCQPAVFFRRTVIEQQGLLDVGLHYCMDYEYWLRVLANYPPYYLTAKLAGSRLHPETKTLGRKEAVHREILEMLATKFGKPDARWVYGLAHVIAREMGLLRDTPEADARFIEVVANESERAFLRYCGGVPEMERPLLAEWRAHARSGAARL